MILLWLIFFICNSLEIHLDQRIQVSFECGEIKRFELKPFEEEQKLWARVMWPGYYPAELVPILSLVGDIKHGRRLLDHEMDSKIIPAHEASILEIECRCSHEIKELIPAYIIVEPNLLILPWSILKLILFALPILLIGLFFVPQIETFFISKEAID